MTVRRAATAAPVEVFADAMARLVSGVAVVTSRHVGGGPCGLLVSSICSYSASPPSVLIAIGRERASYPALVEGEEFGVHVLGAEQREIAKVFAGRRDDKFTGLAWSWEDQVPRIAAVPVFLACARRAVLHHGDHSIVIGDVTRVHAQPGEPLVYYRRRLDWRLS